MEVNLMERMYQKNDPKMPNWSRIEALVPSSLKNIDLLEFVQTHESTNNKITMADYHYHILNQIYRPHQSDAQADTQRWARAEMHSIITNLYSALDSLAYEVSLAFNTGVAAGDVHIHHNHQSPARNCVRCALPQGNRASTILDQELSKPWFATFRNLRHQITHRNIPVINVTINLGDPTTHLMIPNDPANTNPMGNDYSQELEMNRYCLDRRTDVLILAEAIFPILEPLIRQRYGI